MKKIDYNKERKAKIVITEDEWVCLKRRDGTKEVLGDLNVDVEIEYRHDGEFGKKFEENTGKRVRTEVIVFGSFAFIVGTIFLAILLMVLKLIN